MFFSDFIIFSFRKGNQDYFPLKMRKWQKQFKLFAVISSSGVFVLHIFPQWTLRTRSCACARVCILHAYTEKRGGSHWHSQFSGIWSGFLSEGRPVFSQPWYRKHRRYFCTLKQMWTLPFLYLQFGLQWLFRLCAHDPESSFSLLPCSFPSLHT